MLSTTTAPTALQEFTTFLDTAFMDEAIDSSLNSAATTYSSSSEPLLECNDSKTSVLPVDVYQALLQRISSDPSLHHSTQYTSLYDRSPEAHEVSLNATGQTLSHIKHRGKRFCTASYCAADSNIVYRDITGCLRLGRVESLFVHKRRRRDGQLHHQVFAAVRGYHRLTDEDASRDPYRRYSALRATLVYNRLSEEVEVVPMMSVASHFVLCPYMGEFQGGRCAIALPLDQVSDVPSSHQG